jgi:Fic family protein
MVQDRVSIAAIPELITDEDEIAKREAENGIRQFNLAVEIIRTHVKDVERPFRLRSSYICQLNHFALDGIHIFAGTFRNGPVTIGGSKHTPVDALQVPELVEGLCQYVNDNWAKKSALHLSAYILWRLNWIHPFADGNGRTSRAIAYVVLNIKTDSLLPGVPTIPDQISENKAPYYDALEAADTAWRSNEVVDVSAMEEMLEGMLARQLVNAAAAAAGRT